MSDTKVCRDCGRDLPLWAFYANRGKPDGRQPMCVDCDVAGHRARIQHRAATDPTWRANEAMRLRIYRERQRAARQ
jgi:hypothetical protein